MNVEIPLETAQEAAEMAYLMARFSPEYHNLHKKLIKSINNRISFGEETRFKVEINHE